MLHKGLQGGVTRSPHHKDIIIVAPPHHGLLGLGLQELLLKIAHEDVGKRWCDACSHGHSMDLVVVDRKAVNGEDELH